MINHRKDRFFPATELSASIIVVPDELAEEPLMQRLADACSTPLVAHRAFEPAAFAASHVIACGHMGNNAAITQLYNGRRCFVDTLFPGDDAYLVRSISDPMRHGFNAIVAGASNEAGLFAAVAALTAIIDASDGTLGRVYASRLERAPEPPSPAEFGALIDQDLATWDGGWVASPFRGGKLRSYLWNHYLTDHAAWGHLIAAIFAGSIEPWREQRRQAPEAYHDFFHLDLFIHLWDLVEDHPMYEAADRHAVVEMFTDLLGHLAGIFYLKEEINPDGLPRQNHATFIGLNLAAGHEYLSRCYGVTEFAAVSARIERLFEGQASGYKPNDDAGVGYVWHVPRHTLDYLLTRDDYRYLDEGHVTDLCRLLAITTDNLRSEVGYGDSSGFSAFESSGWHAHLWPLLASLWHSGDPTHLWLLNWLAEGRRPGLEHGLESWHATVLPADGGFVLPGVEARLPQDLLGITALRLPDAVLRWVAREVPVAHAPAPEARYFDKLCLRPSFSVDDEYLLLEGIGTLCHGHEDTNAILRLTWKGRAWLADGDYIRAAPRFHNSITVQRDGVGVLRSPGDGLVIPPLARLMTQRSDGHGGLVQSMVVGYNGLDWRRDLVWRSGRYIAVVDELTCTEPGDYSCRCLWRVVGDVRAATGGVRLQQGDAELFVLHADDVNDAHTTREIVEDGGGAWGGYPHHNGPLHVIHQKTDRYLDAGESIRFLHVFTPREGITVDRCGPGLMRITDGDDATIVGVTSGGEAGDTAAAEPPAELTAEMASWVPVGAGGGGLADPPAIHIAPALPRWRRSASEAIGPIALFEEGGDQRVLIADATGGLECVAASDGQQAWRVTLSSPAFVLQARDIDGDGFAEILVGTAASEVIVLDGSTGRQRWRRPLKNLYDTPAPATTLCVADLEGDGELSVLVGTAGWFVNVFQPDGTPKWANWFRYHVITALAAADVDGDGRAEVIVGNTYSTPLTVHEFDGAFRWSTLEQVGAEGNATTPRRGIGLTHLRLADLDGNGRQEILYGTEDGWVYAVDAADGAGVWQLNIVGKVVALEGMPAGIMVANEFGDLYTLRHDGHVSARVHVSEWIHAAVRSGDDLIIANELGQLLRYDATGTRAGAIQADGKVEQLHCTGHDLICALGDGSICSYRME